MYKMPESLLADNPINRYLLNSTMMPQFKRDAAVLHGAAQGLRDRTGGPWEEEIARELRDSLDQARAHLGDEQLERAYAQGMALSLDQALDLALGKTVPA